MIFCRYHYLISEKCSISRCEHVQKIVTSSVKRISFWVYPEIRGISGSPYSRVNSDSEEVNKPSEVQQSEQQSEQEPHCEQQRQVILQITPACAIAQTDITE